MLRVNNSFELKCIAGLEKKIPATLLDLHSRLVDRLFPFRHCAGGLPLPSFLNNLSPEWPVQTVLLHRFTMLTTSYLNKVGCKATNN